MIVATSGVAVAAIPGSDGTVTACLAKDGALKVIDAEAGKTCQGTQTTVRLASTDAAGKVADADKLDGKDATEFGSAADVAQLEAAFKPTLTVSRTNQRDMEVCRPGEPADPEDGCPSRDVFDLRLVGTGLKPGTSVTVQRSTNNSDWIPVFEGEVDEDGTIDITVVGKECVDHWRGVGTGWFGEVISPASAPGSTPGDGC